MREKALLPILVTLLGMVTVVSWLEENAAMPILVTLLGMVTLVSWLTENALVPMLVTATPPILLGISTPRGQAGLAELLPSWS